MSVLDKALRVGEGKQLRRLKEVAEAVNNLEDKITSLSDEDLRGKTADFKKRIENGECCLDNGEGVDYQSPVR